MNSAALALPVRADDQLDVERIAAQIAECKNLDELRDIRDKAKAIEAYQRACNAALQVQNGAIEIRLRAERRMGVILCEVIPHSGGRPKKQSQAATVSLSDINVTKSQSSRSQKLAAVPKDVFEQHIVSTKARGEKLTTSGALSHAPAYESDEWYTPPEYIEAAREVLGGIDLDPASSAIAQKTVKAARYFTRDEDGLSQEWHGHVFLNPPYSNPLGTDFVVKLCDEYEAGRVTEAVLLQNAMTSTDWFHRAGECCSAMCFTRKRIGFLRADGARHDGNRYAQVFCYFGQDIDLFADTFGTLGLVVRPERQAA